MEEQFPPEGAMTGDVIGELAPIPEEITGIMVTLDVTLDVVAQANEKNCNLIIAHHPYYWGESAEEALKRQVHLRAMHELLVSNNIGVYAAHTNADFAPNGLAYMQGLALGLENIVVNDGNLTISGDLKEEMTVSDLADLMETTYELDKVNFRTNCDPLQPIKKLTISSGAGGEYGINLQDSEALHVVGEIKHHEWVRAAERNIKVFELTHFSEKIFKNIVEIFMEKEGIEVMLSEEENPWTSI